MAKGAIRMRFSPQQWPLLIAILVCSCMPLAAWAQQEHPWPYDEQFFTAADYFKRGTYHLQHHAYHKALKDFDAAISAQPAYAEAYNNRGVALKRLGRLEDALQSLNKALQLAPTYHTANLNRSNVLLELERFDEAAADLTTVMEANGEGVNVLQMRGDVYASARRYLAAAKDYGSAVALLKRDAEQGTMPTRAFAATLMSKYGDMLLKTGKQDAAIEVLSQAVMVHPQAINAHLQLGLSYKGLGRFVEAEAAYRAALEHDADNATVRNTLAWLLAICPDDGVRNPAEALQMAEAMVAEAGGMHAADPSILDTKAAAQAGLGQFDAAVETQRLAVAAKQRRGEDVTTFTKRLEMYENGIGLIK